MAESQDTRGPYLPPGTPVSLNSHEEGRPEFGVVVHCWLDDEIGDYDCYVAFFGNEPPTGKPAQKPYVLRYASTSLAVIDTDKPIEPQS